MTVEHLQASVHELRNMNACRRERRECIIQDIGCKLFAMSMAVDEYIMLLSERDFFPPNCSVRNALQLSRYDKIKTMIDTVKAKASQPSLYERINAWIKAARAIANPPVPDDVR